MLISLLEKLLSTATDQSSEQSQQESLKLTEDDLEELASKLTAEQFSLLARGYLAIADRQVRHAQKPFNGQGDIRPVHYKQAHEALGTTKTCLQRVSILLNKVLSLPPAVSSIRERIIVKASRIIESVDDFNDAIEECKNARHIKQVQQTQQKVKDKFTTFLRNLEELSGCIQ